MILDMFNRMKEELVHFSKNTKLTKKERDAIKKLKILTCKQVDNEAGMRDTPETARMLSHVNHRKDVVCIASIFHSINPKTQAGVLLHEIGHIGSQVHNGQGEPNADLWILEKLGIEIMYSNNSLELQYINKEDLERFIGEKHGKGE